MCGNTELGQLAASWLVELDLENDSNCVVLLGIHAAERVELNVEDQGVHEG